MGIVRRVATALALAAIGAAGIRLGGGAGSPPQRGGWRPLELPPEPDEP